MAKSKKALDEELLRECQGYKTRDIKSDGAYIQVGNALFNLNKIKRLIASGADLNTKGYNGQTPLAWAAYWNSLAVAELLISSGAEVNAKDQWGWTPLHRAAYEDSLALAELLISSGAEVNAKDSWDRTPLHWAALDGHPNLAELLISSGGRR